jgi:hypothetical protein
MDDFARKLFTENYLSVLAGTQRHLACDTPKQDYDTMVEVLVDVIREATDGAKAKITWNHITAFVSNAPVACAFRRIEKVRMEVQLGIDFSSVSLRFGFGYPNEIPSLGDDFWRGFLDLVIDHGGKYEITGWPSGFALEKWEQNLKKRRKSALFSMLSDFILISKTSDSCHPVGDLTFSFEHPVEWQALVMTATKIITTGYRLNYMLYRSHYSKMASVLKRYKNRPAAD